MCKFYYKDNTVFEGPSEEAPHHKDSSKILHREGGPARESTNGDKEWWLNGLLHREDGPAMEWDDGAKFWYRNDKCHRIDGPAIEWPSGTREWFLNGKRHREDGPAVERASEIKRWWLNGEELKTLSQEYLIRYMELTGETLTTLLIHPDKMIRDSVKKYKWS